MRRLLPNQATSLPDHGFLDSLRMRHRVYENVRKYEQDKDDLMRAGKAGDIGALCQLWERWRMRLPAVEGRLLFTMPWMK